MNGTRKNLRFWELLHSERETKNVVKWHRGRDRERVRKDIENRCHLGEMG